MVDVVEYVSGWEDYAAMQAVAIVAAELAAQLHVLEFVVEHMTHVAAMLVEVVVAAVVGLVKDDNM